MSPFCALPDSEKGLIPRALVSVRQGFGATPANTFSAILLSISVEASLGMISASLGVASSIFNYVIVVSFTQARSLPTEYRPFYGLSQFIYLSPLNSIHRTIIVVVFREIELSHNLLLLAEDLKFKFVKPWDICLIPIHAT